jgi:hypothetical protein
MLNSQKAKLNEFQPGSPVNVRFRPMNGQDHFQSSIPSPFTPSNDAHYQEKVMNFCPKDSSLNRWSLWDQK